MTLVKESLLYSCSHFCPCPHPFLQLPSSSFELLKLPEDRHTGKQALGGGGRYEMGVMVVLRGRGSGGGYEEQRFPNVNTYT